MASALEALVARSLVPFEVLVSLVPTVRWAVAPARTPRVVRHCSRCGDARPFSSSDRFRVNAQAKKLDVWLIYRCETCESTFNLAVHTRVSPAALGATLERYHHNDVDLAWDVAFDARFTRGAGSVEDVPFRVEAPPAEAPFAVTLGFERPFDVRLDRVLMVGLGVSRSRLEALVDSGRIVTACGRALRRSAAPGQVVYVGDDAAPSLVA